MYIHCQYTKLFRIYLRWSYLKCIEDLKKLGYAPNFTKKDFTALLCGVGNEGTANEFIKFIIQRNPKAKIIIIDPGEEQITAVKKLVNRKYSHLNTEIIMTDVLNLESFIKTQVSH